MVLYQLYFSHILGPKSGAMPLMYFDSLDRQSAGPDLMHWLELISIISLVEEGIEIIFKLKLPEGGGSVGCYLSVKISDWLYRRQSQTAQ